MQAAILISCLNARPYWLAGVLIFSLAAGLGLAVVRSTTALTGCGVGAADPTYTNRRSRPLEYCLALPGLCAVQRAQQNEHRRSVNGTAGFPRARGGNTNGCGHAFVLHDRQGAGGVSGKAPPTTPRSDNSKRRETAQRPCSKKRRGNAPFCCPQPEAETLTWWRGLPARAQDITASYARPRARAAPCGFA